MTESEHIVYFDRYLGETRVENVYGDRWLRWTYGSAPGRFLLETVVKRALFSRLYGRYMSRPASRARIRPFIREYGLDESEFAETVDSFPDFNTFFSRRLKPDARPLAGDESIAVFPADGRHLVFPDLDRVDGVYAKGQRFSLPELVGDRDLAACYAGGSLSISRLCPVDYHRFHFPCAGRAGPATEIPGHLYSVSPFSLRRRLAFLWHNRRYRTVLESPRFGPVLCLEIGATCVGSVVQTYRNNGDIARGDEKGLFRFGGSCVILIFEKARIHFDDDLVANTTRGLETYARMGDRLARLSQLEPDFHVSR